MTSKVRFSEGYIAGLWLFVVIIAANIATYPAIIFGIFAIRPLLEFGVSFYEVLAFNKNRCKALGRIERRRRERLKAAREYFAGHQPPNPPPNRGKPPTNQDGARKPYAIQQTGPKPQTETR